MVSFLNALDPNVARRELRDFLLSIAPELRENPQHIPHSFDTNELLSYAQKRSGKRDVREQPELFLPMVAKTGVALALTGHDEAAVKILKKGYRAADTNQKKAQYLYHIGYHSEHRRGDANKARDTLTEAYVLSERSRRLRGEILLALGTIEMNLGSLDSAERALTSALELHLRELEPHAQLRLSDVATARGDFDTAVQLNRKSHALFKRRRDWKGMKTADSNLAVLRIERGQFDLARTLLDGVIEEGMRVLDITRLGRDFNNRAVLLSQTGDSAGARDAILEAIRFHEAADRRALLIGNYQNLGGYLIQLGEPEPALAAFEYAASIARELDLVSREFQVLAYLLLIAGKHDLTFDALPSVVDRCHQLMEKNEEAIVRKSLVNFASAMQLFAERPGALSKERAVGHEALSTESGRVALRGLAPAPQAFDFANQLESKLGTGLPGRDVPKITELKRFLMQFAGDFFKSGNYTREFSITQERAKRHLRWMCTERLIERQGSRKASRYSLAFHRA